MHTKTKKALLIPAALAMTGLMAGGSISPAYAGIKNAAPEGSTAFTINRVCNQNIAGGYGLGIAIELSGFSGAYWASITGNIDEKIKLYDSSGAPAEVESFEEVGAQMAINRGKGYDYYGYVITFEEGLTFTASTGTNYYLEGNYSYICKTHEQTGVVWDTYIAPTSVEVETATVSLPVGQVSQIVPVVTTTEENPIITYKSSDETIATVDSAGKIVAVSQGTATITVCSALKTATVAVTVTPAVEPQSGILVRNADKKISTYVGYDYDIAQLDVVKVYGDDKIPGEIVEVTAEMISGDFDKNTVGNYTLTITDGGFSDTFTVEVKAIEVTSMKGSEAGNHFGNNSPWGSAFYFVTNVPDTAHYLNIHDEALNDLCSYITVDGRKDAVSSAKNLGGGRYEIWFKEDVTMKAGSKVELAAGLPVYHYSGTVNGANHEPEGDGYYFPAAKLDQSYTYVYTGSTYEVFTADPTDFTLTSPQTFVSVGQELQLECTIIPETAYGTPVFTSSDKAIATVSATGAVSGVAVGNVTITAKLGEIEHSVTLEVTPAKSIKGVEILKTPKYYSLPVGTDVAGFNPTLTSARLVYEDDSFSPAFELGEGDYTISKEFSTATATTEPITVAVSVKYQGTSYNSSIKVNVYEYFDQVASEVAIVDWFIYGTFIQFPNTTTNSANITDTNLLPGLLDSITYARKDGTQVKISGLYQLGTNVAIFPEFLYDENGNAIITAENYNQYYLEGDTITLAANMPIFRWTGDVGTGDSMVEGTGELIVDGYVKETTTYKYNGAIWGLYVEYTDISIGSDTLSVEVGKTVNANASRVPGNATQGSITYATSDSKIATVSSTGNIRGINEGTATITVTLSDPNAPEKTKTATIVVTVTDPLSSLEITDVITTIVGEDIDLSKVNASFIKASGADGGKADLTGATITGYDKTKIGNQNIVITVTKDGKTYTGAAVVNVTNPITGLQLTVGEGGLSVKAGTETLELTGVTAKFVLADGSTSTEVIDLSKAVITNYDKDTVGEQTITVSVTKDGQTVTGTMKITVTKKGGCGGSIIATGSIAVSLVALGSGLFFFRKRKNEK